jgi:hypothetical protein
VPVCFRAGWCFPGCLSGAAEERNGVAAWATEGLRLVEIRDQRASTHPAKPGRQFVGLAPSYCRSHPRPRSRDRQPHSFLGPYKVVNIGWGRRTSVRLVKSTTCSREPGSGRTRAGGSAGRRKRDGRAARGHGSEAGKGARSIPKEFADTVSLFGASSPREHQHEDEAAALPITTWRASPGMSGTA